MFERRLGSRRRARNLVLEPILPLHQDHEKDPSFVPAAQPAYAPTFQAIPQLGMEREAAELIELPLRPGFKADLGLHLMRAGGMTTTFHFSNVPVEKVGILPDGAVSWSSEITLGEQERYVATFDIPVALVPEFRSALGIEGSALAPALQLTKYKLPQPRTLKLE